MIRYQVYNKGITYMLIAILCLTNLFLGAKVIGKLSDIKKSLVLEDYDEEKVIEVFNTAEIVNIEDVALAEDNEMDTDLIEPNNSIIRSNLFLKLLLNSNACMETVYEINYESQKESVFSNFFGSLSKIFEPKIFIKPHLPAIVSAFSDTYSWEEGKADSMKEEAPDLEGYLILTDIVFVEDPEEGSLLNKELETIGKIHNDNLYIERPASVRFDHENPYVLIYHTHGTESYLPVTTGRFHTEDREYNVLAVGEIIAKILEEKGHKVKWIDVYHDIPSYNESYTKSLATVKEEMSKNESIKIVLDIHRDGIEEVSETVLNKAKQATRVNIDGKSVATFSLVIGPDNPNKEQLIKFANYIRHVSDSLYPGLFKNIIIKQRGKFNQYVSDYAALIEVGSNLNTIDEAKESAKYIGEILHKVIEGIEKENIKKEE